MGARQSRQSVNITTATTGSGSTSALNAAAAAAAASTTATGTETKSTTGTATNLDQQSSPAVPLIISNESPEDIKNIVSETGVSGPGKIEPIPEIDVLPPPPPSTEAAAAAAATVSNDENTVTVTETVTVPTDTSVTESMTNQDQSQLNESTTTASKGEGDAVATETTKKSKKLKKKWSFKNLSFSRKKKVLSDSTSEFPQSQSQPQQQQSQQNGGDSKVEEETVEKTVQESDNQLLNNSTATEPSSVPAIETVADSVTDKDTITVQETIEEEENVAVNEEKSLPMMPTTSSATVTATVEPAVVSDEKEEKLSVLEVPAPAPEPEPEPKSPSIDPVSSTLLDASSATVATTTTDVSLNEKMKNLTINDHEITNGEQQQQTIEMEAEEVVNDVENDVHHLNGDGMAAAAEDAAVIVDEISVNGNDSVVEIVMETEPEIIEIPVENEHDDEEEMKNDVVQVMTNGESKVRPTNGLNGNASASAPAPATNGNNEENGVVVTGNGDFVVLDDNDKELMDLPKPDEIAVMKSVQKQVMEEKAQDLIDVEENSLEHSMATEVTNGFSENGTGPAAATTASVALVNE